MTQSEVEKEEDKHFQKRAWHDIFRGQFINRYGWSKERVWVGRRK